MQSKNFCHYNYIITGSDSGNVSRTDVWLLQFFAKYFCKMQEHEPDPKVIEAWTKYQSALQILFLFDKNEEQNSLLQADLDPSVYEKDELSDDVSADDISLDLDNNNSSNDNENPENDMPPINLYKWRETPLIFTFPMSSVLAKISSTFENDNTVNHKEFASIMDEYKAHYDTDHQMYSIPSSNKDITSTDILAIVWNIEKGNKLLWTIDNIQNHIYNIESSSLLTRLSRKVTNSAIVIQSLQYFQELVTRFDQNTLFEFDLSKLLILNKESILDATNMHAHLLYNLQSIIKSLQEKGIDFINATNLPKHLQQALNQKKRNTIDESIFVFYTICYVIFGIIGYKTQNDLTVHFKNNNIKAESISKVLYLLCKSKIINCATNKRSIKYNVLPFTSLDSETKNILLDIIIYISNSFKKQNWKTISGVCNITSYSKVSNSDENECKEAYNQRLNYLIKNKIENTSIALNETYEDSSVKITFKNGCWYRNGSKEEMANMSLQSNNAKSRSKSMSSNGKNNSNNIINNNNELVIGLHSNQNINIQSPLNSGFKLANSNLFTISNSSSTTSSNSKNSRKKRKFNELYKK